MPRKQTLAVKSEFIFAADVMCLPVTTVCVFILGLSLSHGLSYRYNSLLKISIRKLPAMKIKATTAEMQAVCHVHIAIADTIKVSLYVRFFRCELLTQQTSSRICGLIIHRVVTSNRS